MNTKTKIIITTAAFAIFGFMLGPNAPLGAVIWPPNPAEMAVFGEPTAAELGLVMFYSLLASIGFGLAVSLLFFGGSIFQRRGVSTGVSRLAHLALVWILGSFVPHDALHQSITTFGGLVALEYGFHLTLMLGGIALVRYVLASRDASTASGVRAPTVAASPAR